jgi:hypothetical protein
MVNSQGCSIKEAFGLQGKKKKEMYEENGKSLEYIGPSENKKSKDSFKVSDNNYQKIESSQTDLEREGDGLTSQDKKVLASITSDNNKLTEENMNMKDEIKKLKAYDKYHKERYLKTGGDLKNIKESFSNFNDDFNDVLLFALLGFFYLIFTDYVYKLGKRSY